MKTIKIIILLSCIFSLFIFVRIVLADQNNTNGEKVYKMIINKYESLESYRDSGHVVYYIGKPENPIIFKTYFIKPDLFRFEWNTLAIYPYINNIKSQHFILYDGKEAFIFESGRGSEKVESLALALASATGISRGSAPSIASLLLPNNHCSFGLESLHNISHLGTETINKIMCNKIKGIHKNGKTIEIWSGIHDNIIRKIKLLDYEIIYSEIEVNLEIDDSIFDLKWRSLDK